MQIFALFTAPRFERWHCPFRVYKKGTDVKDIKIAGLTVHFLPLPDFWRLRDVKHDTLRGKKNRRGNLVYRQWRGVTCLFSFSFFLFLLPSCHSLPSRVLPHNLLSLSKGLSIEISAVRIGLSHLSNSAATHLHH